MKRIIIRFINNKKIIFAAMKLTFACEKKKKKKN